MKRGLPRNGSGAGTYVDTEAEVTPRPELSRLPDEL